MAAQPHRSPILLKRLRLQESGTVDSEEVHRTPLTPPWERRIWRIRPVQRFDCCCRVAVIQLSRKIQPGPTVPEMGRSTRIENRCSQGFPPHWRHSNRRLTSSKQSEHLFLQTDLFFFHPSKKAGPLRALPFSMGGILVLDGSPDSSWQSQELSGSNF